MKKIVIDPLSRVEGHGRIELILQGGRLYDVRVMMMESPRLFEKIVVGRKYDEIADLVCRICSICSAVHKLTALAALEKAYSVKVPPLARLIRELLLLGGHIQSHALHLFCLVLPDFSGSASLLELLHKNDPLAEAGLQLKALGNRIQDIAGGRVIHPINPVFGGTSFRPTDQTLKDLMDELGEWMEKWPGISDEFCSRARFPRAGGMDMSALAVGSPGSFSLDGDLLWSQNNMPVAIEQYRDLLKEKTAKETYAKLSCGDKGPYYVGAAARAVLAAERGGPPSVNRQGTGIFENNFAQLYEITWALGQSIKVIEKILLFEKKAPLLAKNAQIEGAGVGTAALEAPRGLLVHHYVVDDWGHIAQADIVTPTAINQIAIRDQIMHSLEEDMDIESMKSMSEQIVRAFDPCISCAVHVLARG